MSSPFSGKNEGFLNGVGRGKDSVVMALRADPDNWVVKFNHDCEGDMFALTKYLKRKYEILQAFIPQHIPKSHFVLGNKDDGDSRKTKAYTVQQRIHGLKIGELSPEQIEDERFIRNLHSLVRGLHIMHTTVSQLNEGLDPYAQVDTILDLGGLSKQARITDTVDLYDLTDSIRNSPNIMVDPESLQLYCVDFGRGYWNEEKEETFNRLMEIANPSESMVDES
ncbi:hypothetical protein GF389_03120 [Candidatus Dojkabacteria bacterium]|nr:hypothetical protein [Candidatus Dojkabacteria bacterium]